MADINISVGITQDESVNSFNTLVKSLVKELQKEAKDIKVSFDSTSINNMKSQINELKKGLSEIQNMGGKLNIGANYTNVSSQLNNIASSAKSVVSSMGGFSSAINNSSNSISRMEDDVEDLDEELGKLVKRTSVYKNAASEMTSQVKTYKNALNNTTTTITSKLKKDEEGLEDLVETSRKVTETFQKTAKATQSNNVKSTVKPTVSKVSQEDLKTSTLKQYYTTLEQCENALRRFSAAQKSSNSSSREQYQNISNQVRGLKSAHQEYESANMSTEKFVQTIKKAKTSLAGSTQKIKENGDATKSLTDRMGAAVNKFTSWLAASQGVMYVVQSIRKMVSATIELDSAMTELKKVTDASDGTYAQFLDNASSRTEQLGASLSDVVNSTADFARLGYGIQEATSLSDAATIYKNVGDGIESIDEASQSIISTMQAFGVQADDAMSIVDKFNEVGKVMPNSTVMC